MILSQKNSNSLENSDKLLKKRKQAAEYVRGVARVQFLIDDPNDKD